MVAPVMAAAVVASVCAAGFAANELTHGQMAEAMGFGHHHLMDDAGEHCPMVASGHMDRAACERAMHNGTGMPGG